jgi:ABC-type polysaccharide/polyol phosphate export permease
MAQRQFPMSMSETTGHFMDTMRVLVSRDFRMRYKGSLFGVLWALITPIVSVAILQFVFTRIMQVGIPHFPAFLYTGILPWTWFATSAQSGSSILNDNRDLLRTPFFAKTLLPWTVTCTNFVFYLISLPVLFALLIYEGLPLTGALIALPLVWLVQWILTIGFTLLMAAIGTVVRDLSHLLTMLLMFWFYLTPIIYDLSQVPSDLAPLFNFNPLTPLVVAHRQILMEGQLPTVGPLATVTVVAVGLFAVGLLVFRALEDTFIDRA